LFYFTPFQSAIAVDKLASGQIHQISPIDTNCITAEIITPTDAVVPRAKAECSESTGTADVRAGSGRLVTRAVSATATALFEYPFTIESSVASDSFIPMKVNVIVDWASMLKNTRKLKFAGSSSLDVYIQLRRTTGELVARKLIFGSRHEGISGCISIPTDLASTRQLALGCFLARYQYIDSPATFVSLDAVVQVGETYEIELGITANAQAKFSLDPNDNVVATTPIFVPINEFPIPGRTDSPGLKWENMTISMGTDPADVVADLQRQIDEMRDDLENHTHDYLTGPGSGHNSKQATSSPAIIP